MTSAFGLICQRGSRSSGDTDVRQFVTKEMVKDAGEQQTEGAWGRPGRRPMPELGVQPSPSTWKLFEPPT